MKICEGGNNALRTIKPTHLLKSIFLFFLDENQFIEKSVNLNHFIFEIIYWFIDENVKLSNFISKLFFLSATKKVL